MPRKENLKTKTKFRKKEKREKDDFFVFSFQLLITRSFLYKTSLATRWCCKDMETNSLNSDHKTMVDNYI